MIPIPNAASRLIQRERSAMPLCEIIYVKHQTGNGWKWRPITGRPAAEPSKETFALFYECVSAARAKGYNPNRKCL